MPLYFGLLRWYYTLSQFFQALWIVKAKSSLKIKTTFGCWKWPGISCHLWQAWWNLRKLAANFAARNEICKWPYKEQSVLRNFSFLCGSVSPLPLTACAGLERRLMALCLQVFHKSQGCGGERGYEPEDTWYCVELSSWRVLAGVRMHWRSVFTLFGWFLLPMNMRSKAVNFWGYVKAAIKETGHGKTYPIQV